MADRWEVEYVIALAPDPGSAAAARRLALAAHWTDTGCDARAVWGRYRGAHAEPYEVAVELEEAACRCTCLSRKSPCKHALGLLLLWSAQAVLDDVARPPYVSRWLRRRPAAAAAPGPAAPAAPAGGAGPLPAGPAVALAREPPPGAVPERAGEEAGIGDEGDDDAGVEEPSPLARADPPPDAGRRAAERAARVAGGLAELDRWLTDQVRTGLADAGLHRPEPWEAMAARLVDAQAGSLANRLRRLAARVATAPDHHEVVVAELGLLHLLACGGRRTVHLPGPLADAVRAAVGWTVRQDDVRALPPVTDRWLVAGRSDVQEDRIVVRRTWLQGTGSGCWAMILSFAAYGQALDGGLAAGASLEADVHFYPSARPLRALLGVVHSAPRLHRPSPGAAPPDPITVGRAGARAAGLRGSLRSPHSADAGPGVEVEPAPALATVDLAAACDEVGAAVAAEPWLERWPIAVRAAPALQGGRWVLSDGDGSLPVAPDALAAPALMDLVALSGGRPLAVAAEWTPDGLVPLAAHLDDRVVDVGPFGPWGYG